MSVHVFTEEYSDKNYQPTTTSIQPQSNYWPSYLPSDETRLFIFERSKNAQLIVYRLNYIDVEKRLLHPKCPIDIQWQSYGWTTEPTCNPTGMIERKMAWGYAHKVLDGHYPNASYGSQFTLTLNAFSSRPAQLYFDAKGRVILQTTIQGMVSRLWKVYVCTADHTSFIPRVLYIELYGTTIETNQEIIERIQVSN